MSEKFRAKFPATRPGRSMIKIGRLDDAFLEVFLPACRPGKRSITAAKRKEKEKKEREKNLKLKKPKDTRSSQNVAKRDSSDQAQVVRKPIKKTRGSRLFRD